MRSGAIALGVLLALAAAPVAHAAVIPGTVIAGPSANIGSVPSLAIAPDGSGVVAYRQAEGSFVRVWASRRVGGVWQPPQQLTGGMQASVSDVEVGAANGGRVIVAFKAGAPSGAAAFRYAPGTGQPFGATTEIRGSQVSDLALATNAAAVSYALIQTADNLFAYRISGETVTPVGSPTALDTNGAMPDFITSRSIAVDAAGNAVAAWAENPAPNTAFARRITGTALAPAAVEASAASLGGFPEASGGSGFVGVDSDDGGRAWVSFRQEFGYGGGNDGFRGVVRRLVGSAFEAPLRIDNLPAVPPSGLDAEQPQGAVTSDGTRALATAHANTSASGAPYLASGATLVPGAASPFGLHTTPAPEETFESVAVVSRGAGLFAFVIQPTSTSPASLRARTQLQGGGLDPATLTLSDPALGPVSLNNMPAAADGADSASVAYLQGGPGSGRILVATVDLPRLPVAAAGDKTAPRVTRFGLSRRRFRRGSKLPKLSAVKTGTTIRFRLSEKAAVRLTFERKRKGRRVGRKCRKPTRRNRTRRRCTRHVKVRTAVRLKGKVGANRVRFHGRLTRRRSLAPGSYRITLVATDPAKNSSKPQRKSFRLLKAAKRKPKR